MFSIAPRIAFLVVLLSLGMLFACGGSEPTPTPAPPTPVSEAGQPAPTAAETVAASTLEPTQEPSAAPIATQPSPTVAEATAVPTVPVPTEVPQAPAPAAVTAPVNYFGVSTNGEIFYNDEVRALATLAGVQMVRTSVSWADIEATKGSYNWSGADHLYKVLTENNLQPLMLIMKNPSWAANTHCGPVQDLLAFDAFVRELGTRYPGIHYWALYNEPDNTLSESIAGGCFGGQDVDGNGQPDVNDYAEMLRIARRALNETNPQAELVTGALAFDNFDTASAPPGYPGGGQGGTFNYRFLEQLLQYIQQHPLPPGEKYFDDLGFNFYRIYGPYWESQVGGVGVIAKFNKLNGLLQQYGVQAGLMVSETGADSSRIGNDEQSEHAIKTFTRGLAAGLRHAVWWTFQDFSDSAPPPSNTWKYGLIDQNATPKPAYAAYQTMTNQLNGAPFVQDLQVQGGEGYVFSKGGDVKAVVWSATDAPTSMAFAARTLQLTDMYGKVKAIVDGAPEDGDSAEGRISLQVGRLPMYVQVVSQ